MHRSNRVKTATPTRMEWVVSFRSLLAGEPPLHFCGCNHFETISVTIHTHDTIQPNIFSTTTDNYSKMNKKSRFLLSRLKFHNHRISLCLQIFPTSISWATRVIMIPSQVELTTLLWYSQWFKSCTEWRRRRRRLPLMKCTKWLILESWQPWVCMHLYNRCRKLHRIKCNDDEEDWEKVGCYDAYYNHDDKWIVVVVVVNSGCFL